MKPAEPVVFTRAAPKRPSPLLSDIVYVSACPESIRTLDGLIVAVGAAYAVICTVDDCDSLVLALSVTVSCTLFVPVEHEIFDAE